MSYCAGAACKWETSTAVMLLYADLERMTPSSALSASFHVFPFAVLPPSRLRLSCTRRQERGPPACISVCMKEFLQYLGEDKKAMLTGIPVSRGPDVAVAGEAAQQGQTVDFGIQVDLNQNPESLQNMLLCDEGEECLEFKSGLTCEERRKLKKKLNKKRRKEKAAENQREARRQIGNIIQEFYEGKARFQDYRGRIEELVELIYNNDFRDYLDQLIRMRVNYIQKAIWEYTQTILEENHFEKSDDHVFYSQMVDKIFETFLEIEESSQEIEKIINIYLRFAYQKNESKEEIIYNNLAINTFNYMIETDETLKNLLHICDKKIGPARPEQRKKLEELISIIDSYYDDYQEDYDENSTNCPQDDLQSTGHSEDDEVYEEKKKRRRRIKENDLSSEQDVLMNRLNSLTFREEERVECRISEEYLSKWGELLRVREKRK